MRARFGTTIFLTTHYMDEAAELCDHVAFLHDGKVAGHRDAQRAMRSVGAGCHPRRRLHRAYEDPRMRRIAGDYLSQTLAIAEAEVRKLRHDPIDLFTRIVQPALWLLIFGQVFARLRDIPTGGVSYRDFLAPGHPRAERAVHRDFLRHLDHLGAGPRHPRACTSSAPRRAPHSSSGKSLAAGIRGLAQARHGLRPGLAARHSSRLGFSSLRASSA